MKFCNRCKVAPNGRANNTPTLFPNLTCRNLIPCKVSILELNKDGAELPVQDIQCKISVGNACIVDVNEAYFSVDHEIDLSDHKLAIQKSTGDLLITIISRGRDWKDLAIYVDYQPSIGGIIFQGKNDHYEQILSDVYAAGVCTKLVLTFNRRLKDLQLRPTIECMDKDLAWISGLEIDTSSNSLRPSYTLEFSEDLEIFSKYLNFMQLFPTDSLGEDQQKEPLTCYAVAYGFSTRK